MRYIVPIVTAICFASAGCASLPKEMNAKPSSALSQETDSRLRDVFEPFLAKHPGESGFYFYNRPRRALLSRLNLANLAEHTLDLQYFIWKSDAAGRLFMQHVVAAADRGVRVRLLLDDFYGGDSDFGLAALNAHPNLEIRLYNPFASRTSQSWARSLAFLGDFSRLNHRMHNKLTVADNQVAIVGGRNIGDEYFGLNDAVNFRDFDLLAVGPVVDETSQGFDRYWNSEWAVPLEAIIKDRPGDAEAAGLRQELLDRQLDSYEEYRDELTPERERALLNEFAESLAWGRGRFVYDEPRKDLNDDAPGGVAAELDRLGQEVREDLLIISPYFIPTQTDRDGLAAIARRGVRVRILTNSHESNDVGPAQYGYREKRTEVIETGAELYELRHDADHRGLYQDDPNPAEHLGLHAKGAIIDREIVFLGSFNLDQRSEFVNTEAALLIHSPELAERVIAAVEKDLHPSNSYRVRARELEIRKDGTLKAHDVVWETEDDGQTVVFESEPNVGLWSRIWGRIYTIRPDETHLYPQLRGRSLIGTS